MFSREKFRGPWSFLRLCELAVYVLGPRLLWGVFFGGIYEYLQKEDLLLDGLIHAV